MDILGKQKYCYCFFVSLYLVYVPFIKYVRSKLIISFLGLWCLLNAFLCIACSNSSISWCSVTWASSPFAHTHTVHLQGSLMKGYHMGCLRCAWPGEETCVVSVKGERWCVKARLICLWLALIKVTPRRAVNTHRDSLIIKLQRVLRELSQCLCLLFPLRNL